MYPQNAHVCHSFVDENTGMQHDTLIPHNISLSKLNILIIFLHLFEKLFAWGKFSCIFLERELSENYPRVKFSMFTVLYYKVKQLPYILTSLYVHNVIVNRCLTELKWFKAYIVYSNCKNNYNCLLIFFRILWERYHFGGQIMYWGWQTKGKFLFIICHVFLHKTLYKDVIQLKFLS